MRRKRPLSRSLVAAAACVATAAAALMVLIARPDATPSIQVADRPGWTTILDDVPFHSFEPVDTGRSIVFPMDHGAHTGSPADAWNLAAHLVLEGGEEAGVQISMARLAIAPPDEPPAASDWEIREFWRGHATLVLGDARSAIGEERFRRGFRGIAAYDSEQRELRLDNWSIRFAGGADDQSVQIVASIGPTTAIALDLVPEKPTVTPAAGSVGAPFIGYAMTRLRAEGTLTTAEGIDPVSGVAWFEHLWGDLPFPGGPTATDRLVLLFDDGTEMSVTRTRRRDGAGTPSVDGFVVQRDGEVARVSEDMELVPEGVWQPERGGPGYPVRWTLTQEGNEVQILPLVEDQLHGSVAPAWSGMVVAEGASDAGPVSAVGTLQLQGYAEQ